MIRFLGIIAVLVCLTTHAGAEDSVPVVPAVGLALVQREFKDHSAEKDGIVIVTLPRNDLNVVFEGDAVPAGAGIQTTLRFWRCPCNKTLLLGDFCVVDYESNDVMDSLRAGGFIKIASVAPLLVNVRPQVLSIRFQGEGPSEELIKAIKTALEYVGPARSAPTTQSSHE